MPPPEPPPAPGERVAIVGSGISGLTCAYLLHPAYDVTVYEQNDYFGGHTHTVEIDDPVAGRVPVDTGFIVFNDWTYPNFIRLLERLGVAWQDSDMTFSVSCERTGLEYAGGTLSGLFAQRANLASPRFYRLLADLLRFYDQAPDLLNEPGDECLGDFVRRGGYSRVFIEQHLIPMGASIWSAPADEFLAIPARFVIRFFVNHGMLNLWHRPLWRTVRGGSWTYVRSIRAAVGEARFRAHTRVRGIRRDPGGVVVETAAGRERFDRAIIATHGDEVLGLLSDAAPLEREVLGTFRYQTNEAALHTDHGLLPRNPRAWAAWNYRIQAGESGPPLLTYYMNVLQRLPVARPVCVSLNAAHRIAPERVLQRMTYAHPVFTPAGVAAQPRQLELSAGRRTYYCGAYWRYGFHEDGVVSALAVCRLFGRTL